MKKYAINQRMSGLVGKGIVTTVAAIMLIVQSGPTFPAWADVKEQKPKIYDIQYDSETYGNTRYFASTIIYVDGTQKKSEDWTSYEDNKKTKRVTTHRDGSQDVEERFYNSDGNQILYTKVSSDGFTARNTTTYTNTGSISIYIDSDRSETYTTEEYDTNDRLTKREQRHTYADGTVEYSTYTSSNNHTDSTRIDRVIAPNGTETYVEEIEDTEGKTVTQKTREGILSVERYDRNGNFIGGEETMPDGTVAALHITKNEDGQRLTKIRRYSDGTEDHINYEYDSSFHRIKETEIRRNGVTAVTDYEHMDKGLSRSITCFNNGYQLITEYPKRDYNIYQIIITYNVGEVFQDMRFYQGTQGFDGKRTYSDGRIDEIHVDFSTEDFTEQFKAWSKLINDYHKVYLETAWSTPPVQAE